MNENTNKRSFTFSEAKKLFHASPSTPEKLKSNIKNYVKQEIEKKNETEN